MSVTRAANSSPDAALTVTVAGWPTLTEPMSDSLSETSIVKRLSCARVIKPDELPELEESDEPEPPRPPSDARAVGRARAARPTARARPDSLSDRPLIAAIVPVIGARKVVAASAFSALVRLSSALSTLASAAASEIWLPPEPEPLLEPLRAEPPACEEPPAADPLLDAELLSGDVELPPEAEPVPCEVEPVLPEPVPGCPSWSR